MGAKGAAARWTALPALALALVLLAGCGAQQTSAGPAVPAAPAPESVGPLAAGELQDPRTSASAEIGSGEGVSAELAPVRIRIPSIGVDASLEDLGIDGDGRLSAPVDYDLPGWYADGVVPGSVGPAIIAGHVDSPTAPAVFLRLGELAPGDEIAVAMTDGTERVFHVSGSAQSAKAEFPTAEVYSNVPAPELRLITCAGAFDSSIGHYTDNLIVFATLG